jgi:hypothetical protein
MISRSEYGPRCPHCLRTNPALVLPENGPASEVKCIHCGLSFSFWIEKLPFYCTDDGRQLRCDCDVCTGKVKPTVEIEPEDPHG